MSKQVEKIESTEEAWEEGRLGLDENSVRVSDTKIEDLDDALELKLISIRLRKQVINDLKAIATIEGVGYQALIKQLLDRFIAGETRRYMHKLACEQAQKLIDEEVEAEEAEERKRA